MFVAKSNIKQSEYTISDIRIPSCPRTITSSCLSNRFLLVKVHERITPQANTIIYSALRSVFIVS